MTEPSLLRNIAGYGVGVGLTVVSGLSYLYYKFYKKIVIPTKWRPIGILEEFYFFPIKSCGAINLETALCENLGVRQGDIRDRSLMLIDESGQLITARTYPQMFQIVPRVVGRTQLVISAPGMEDLYLDFSTLWEESNGDIQALIYGFTCNVMDCGDKYHKWFSKFILEKSEGLKLVYYPYSIPTRPIDKDYVEGSFTKRDTGTFHDVSSYHLMNNKSVEDLNTRLKNQLSPLQFRSNFYINTEVEAYDEDHWQWIKIGDEAIFQNIGPCFRCILPNINPYSSKRDPDDEPLKILKTYRVIPGAKTKSPGMGIQMGLRNEGVVKNGDVVYIEDWSKN